MKQVQILIKYINKLNMTFTLANQTVHIIFLIQPFIFECQADKNIENPSGLLRI